MQTISERKEHILVRISKRKEEQSFVKKKSREK
jgi:hypothetical protein